MYPDMVKFSRLKWFKFVPRLISMWGIRKCHHFDPKLPTFAIANSFTVFLIYALYGSQNGKIKQIEGVKFVPRLMLKRGIRKCQYFDPKLPTLRTVLPTISFTYYMDPDTSKFSTFKWLKFVPRLISMWGIRKCHHFNPKLPTYSMAKSFTAYLFTYYMDLKTAKLCKL